MIEASDQVQTSTVDAAPRRYRASHAKSATVRVVDASELKTLQSAWWKLSQAAIVPNPFYEPWTMLSALEHLCEGNPLKILLVFGPAGRDRTEPLWGLFPLEVQSKCLHLPIRTLAFWQHRYCPFAQPLIDARHIWETLEAFWRWFEQAPWGCHLLDTNYLLAEGPFHAVWSDFAIGRTSVLVNEHPRAAQRPVESFDAYLASVLPVGSRSENRRKERRLSEVGAVVYSEVETVCELEAWIEGFAALEAKGWKGGPEGGAFAKRNDDMTFLREIMREGFSQHRLSLMSLRLDGQAIAMKSVFMSGGEGFGFKSAYDEGFSKYSPGLLLAIEHLRRLFGQRRICRMDACTTPRHSMHDMLAKDRRIIRRTLYSDGSRLGDCYASALPVARWVKKQVRPQAGASYLRISTQQNVAGQRSASSATVEMVGSLDLRPHLDTWQRLCSTAIEPNVFYEPWTLLPLAEAHPDQDSLRFLLIFGPAGKDESKPLWGFFPLLFEPKCLHLPIRSLTFWQHRFCYLTVPLIDKAHVREVLDAFWRWFERNPFGCWILDTNFLLADGPFHEAWTDFAIGRQALVLRDFPRAFLAPSEPAEAYIPGTVPKKRLDEYLRQERRLAELGKLEYSRVSDLADVDRWVDEFLDLEAMGWKGGQDGKAYAKQAEDASYFRTITRDGFRRDRAMLLSLTLDGKAIAMKHTLLASSEGGFTLRIAYDENYAKYSPGVLLELDNIRKLSDNPRIKWLDSCAKPRHLMADRIWRERRMIRRTLFSDSSRLGDLWVSIFPGLRFLRQQVRPTPIPDYLAVSTRRKPKGR